MYGVRNEERRERVGEMEREGRKIEKSWGVKGGGASLILFTLLQKYHML